MIGSTLSHYVITAKLGEGGMGVVYEAEDQKLKRRVALKLLPPETAGDPARLERFRREAEIVAALNHPNVVAIHSIEEADGHHFLTMELVEGDGLDALARGPRMPLTRVLRITEAIAAALAAAHERGVVHRDIKPANVMLTRDDHVKVLDFGLGKLTHDPASGNERATQLLTEAAITTDGAVMGTVSYMSPEQARGQTVDHRSDIFSLGCVLYQAATDTLPFRGESSVDTLHQILHDDPRPVDELAPEAPPQLQWILRKALTKEPAERYQSARELAADLRNLRRDLDSGATRSSVASLSDTSEPVPSSSSMATAVRIVVWALVAAAAVLGPWWFMGRDSGEPEPVTPTTTTISLSPITSSGKVTTAAISPDGNYVAYVESEQGRQSLNLRSLQGARSLQLIPPRRIGYWGLTFTPDGSAIVFGEKSLEHRTGAFFRISTLGGSATQLVTGIDSAPTFSPNGDRMAWVLTRHPAPDESSLMVANADGTEVRTLVTVQAPELFAPIFFTTPSWSPDGELIAATVLSSGETATVRAFDATTGEKRWTAADEWEWASMVAWLPQGDGLLVIGISQTTITEATPRLAGQQVWFVPYPEGIPVRLTNDLLTYRILSLVADGESLLTVQSDTRSGISLRPRDGSSRPRRISHSKLDGRHGVGFTADGRILHQTLESGRMQIAVMNPDGSGRRALTDSPEDHLFPIATPDGRVAYAAMSRRGSEIRTLSLDGGDERVVMTWPGTAAGGASGPRHFTLSPDGEWVVYEEWDGALSTLWRRKLEGGEPEQLTDQTYSASDAAVSLDGMRLAYYYIDPEENTRWIGVMPFAPGEPRLRLKVVPPFTGTVLRWDRDGEALLLNTMPGDRANIWRMPLDGGDPRRLTDFDDELLFWFESSPDGQTFALARGELLRDAVLIQGFR